MTRNDRLYALAETFRAFAEVTPDYRVLLETVAREMTRLIGDACIVVLAGDDGAWLEAGATYARDARGMAALRAAMAMRGHPLVGAVGVRPGDDVARRAVQQVGIRPRKPLCPFLDNS